MKIIGIAGGSGCGKSTLAISLCKKYPEKVGLLHLDDYFKKPELIPKELGFLNFDQPDALGFDDLYSDLVRLKNGEPVNVFTKSELYNPGYDSKLKNRVWVTIEPREIMLVEGYLSLYDKRMRDIMYKRIYLDIPIEVSLNRRSANKTSQGENYMNKVLIPMFKKFVEPTKAHADLVFDVSNKNADEVFNMIDNYLTGGGSTSAK